MRKIIAITHLTLDGVMQAPGGPEEDTDNGFGHGGWSMQYGDEEFGRIVRETIAADHELLLGRRTYEIWAAYWPQHADNVIGRKFNAVRKYVATNTLRQLDWEHSQPLSGDIVGQLRELKAGSGPDMHVWGSSNLLQTLTAAGLVDEYRTWIYPLVLGEGKRLFEAGLPPRKLRLSSTLNTPGGIVLNTYERIGAE